MHSFVLHVHICVQFFFMQNYSFVFASHFCKVGGGITLVHRSVSTMNTIILSLVAAQGKQLPSCSCVKNKVACVAARFVTMARFVTLCQI